MLHRQHERSDKYHDDEAEIRVSSAEDWRNYRSNNHVEAGNIHPMLLLLYSNNAAQ
jgi:hypothetical protein